MRQNTFRFKLPKSEIKPCLFGLQNDDVVPGDAVHAVVAEYLSKVPTAVLRYETCSRYDPGWAKHPPWKTKTSRENEEEN